MNINKRLRLMIVVGLAAFTPCPALALSAEQQKMVDQLDQLDQLDHMDFVEQNDKANECVFKRNYNCAEQAIAKASKSISSSRDKNELSITQQNLAKERQLQAAEEKAERERQEAEERRIEQARQQRIAEERRQEEKRQSDANFRAGMALLTGTAVAYSARNYSPEQQRALVQSAENDVMNGTNTFNSTANGVSAEREQRHNEQMREIAAQQERRADEARRERDQRELQRAQQAEQDRARRPATVAAAAPSRPQPSAYAAPQRVAQNANVYGGGSPAPAVIGTTVQGYNPTHVAQAPSQQSATQPQRSSNQTANGSNEQSAQDAKRQAEKDYLAALTQGIRLHATKCPDGEGRYYATGTMPKTKRELSCIDVHFRASCPGSAAYSDGILGTFGTFGGCLGDLAQIDPKPACPVEQVRVEVTSVTGCTSGKW